MQTIKKKLKPTLLFIAMSIGFTLSPYTQAQNFYKWVDANGSTHYTTTPPPKNAKKLGSVNTINDTPSGSSYKTPTPETQPTPAQEVTQDIPENVTPVVPIEKNTAVAGAAH